MSQAECDETHPSEYYGPNDLRIGETIFIFGRRFLLTDCDFFTRNYYAEALKTPQSEPIRLKEPQQQRPHTVNDLIFNDAICALINWLFSTGNSRVSGLWYTRR